MFKKIFALCLCVCLFSLAGCTKKTESLSISTGDESSTIQKQEVVYKNPLTGLGGIDKEAYESRPVAIMINNISTAQPVQTGLTQADIVYETEVEGGITRLLAVYQNIKDVEQIGTVRSARYAFIDMALGHNAIYVHHGADEDYAGQHLRSTDHFEVDVGNGGARISNGLAKEHTLYAYGDKIWEKILSSKRTIAYPNPTPWQTFASEDSPVSLEYTATSVTVPFSPSYKTTFKYDSVTGRYTRYFNNTERKDYITKQSITFKNVFVLETTITNYSDHYHRKVALDSGEGYYFVNGTYTKIKWSKGAASNGFTFTNLDGTPLTVNPGNSWVCIANKSTSSPIIA
ncbi:MAG: DUF3048 domain-containing protein [Acutalibacteraceae bacterium]|jgi:hypothetical protein